MRGRAVIVITGGGGHGETRCLTRKTLTRLVLNVCVKSFLPRLRELAPQSFRNKACADYTATSRRPRTTGAHVYLFLTTLKRVGIFTSCKTV